MDSDTNWTGVARPAVLPRPLQHVLLISANPIPLLKQALYDGSGLLEAASIRECSRDEVSPVKNLWCVRAAGGIYAEQFVRGRYAAIGWIDGTDLSAVRTKDELAPLYRAAHPNDKSNVVIGQQVGQIARFLLEITEGDYVITPALDTEFLHFGTVAGDPSYFYALGDDGCPYRHRRRIEWAADQLRRDEMSVPFQKTMRSSLTVFSVSQRDEFFTAIDRPDLVPFSAGQKDDGYKVVLDRLCSLDATEFEVLLTSLLAALGFEAQHTGRTGDGGVDVTGELNVFGLAKVKLVVQVKQYKPGRTIAASTVKGLRQMVPHNAQGAVITTADFQDKAHVVASEPGFQHIGLINGRQLVDLLVEHWGDIPQEFQTQLGLQPGLIPV